MAKHAEPAGPTTSPAGTPTLASRARTLLSQGDIGTLSTMSRKLPGYPYASLMPYALDAIGQPMFLISSMAVHTKNLQADARASLLVTQPGATGEPLAASRVTLLGRV